MQPKTPASTVVRSLNDDHQAFRENIYDTDLTDEQFTRNYDERLNILESQLVLFILSEEMEAFKLAMEFLNAAIRC